MKGKCCKSSGRIYESCGYKSCDASNKDKWRHKQFKSCYSCSCEYKKVSIKICNCTECNKKDVEKHNKIQHDVSLYDLLFPLIN